ncbi:MAG: hypothetical protein J1F03_04255 [Oscillospiraceae bacterium]|nr:hypothetical protein [Oscillospiraceae bacterium]
MKKNEPIYEEMRSLMPYFLIISGIYLLASVIICFANGGDYSLPIGAVYGCILSAASFFLLGKACQGAVKRSEKSAQTYMSAMYCARYLGLFAMLTIGALAPFISLITSVVPLFFPRIAIMIRAIKTKEE